MLHQAKVKNVGRVYLLLLLALLAAILLSLMLGSTTITPAQLWQLGTHPTEPSELAAIVFKLRLPRLAMTLLVGALLATSGLIYQTTLRNPLAEPYILGVSSGAALFAVLGHWLFDSAYLPTMLTAFGGGVATMCLLLGLTRRPSGRGVTPLLLTGVMVNFLMAALMMVALFLLRPNAAPTLLTLWLGSFSGVWQWEIALLTILLLFGGGYFWRQGRALNALMMGEEWASNVGFAARDVQRRALLFASLMVAATVACVGMIGFVGLLVPHLLRRFLPGDIRGLLPATMLGGALFMLIADSGSRQLLMFGVELPVGVISAILGSPLFIAILMHRQQSEGSE